MAEGTNLRPALPRGISMAKEKKPNLSRRNFLRTAALGAATVGAVATAPSVLGIAENVGAVASDFGNTPLVAYVKDATRGTVVVMWGTREVETADPGLVARIALYAKG
jgi:hypothetical protein